MPEPTLTKTEKHKATTPTRENSQGQTRQAAPIGPVAEIMDLQESLGNRAVGQVLQAKLKINQPGDKYELEADRVAEMVMRMPDRGVGSISKGPQILQRKCACADGKGTCAKCAGEENKLLQRKATAAAPAVTRGIAANINGLRGGGQPLPDSARSFFEPRFRADFSGVRVHTGSRAAQTSRSISARAFTVGKDVVFGAGQYSPGTDSGRGLMAHELTHVVQQGGILGNKNNGQIIREQVQKKEISEESLTYQLRHHLYYSNLEESIKIIKQLSDKEKDFVLASEIHKNRATEEYAGDEFGDESVYKLIKAFTENGYRNLWGCLDWMLSEFDENSGWNYIEEIVGKHSTEQRTSILYDEKMKKRFSNTYGDREIFFLMRDFMARIDLAKSLEWLFFEADPSGGEFYRERAEAIIELHPEEQKKQVREDETMKNAFILHMTDFGIATVVDALGLRLKDKLEWMMLEDTNYYLVGEAFINTKQEDELNEVKNDSELNRRLKNELGDSYELFKSYRETAGQVDLSKKEGEDKEFLEKSQDLLSQFQKVKELRLSTEIQKNTGLGLNSPELETKLIEAEQELELLKKKNNVDTKDGITTKEFEKTIERYLETFKINTVKKAFAMLRQSEEVVKSEAGKYGVDSKDNNAFENLWKALKPVREIKVEHDKKINEIRNVKHKSEIELVDELRGSINAHLRRDEILNAYKNSKDKFNKFRKESKLSIQFPVLADPDLELSDLWSTDKSQLRNTIGGTIRDRLSDIHASRKSIAEDPDVIWSLDQLLAAAKQMYAIKKGSALDKLIDDKAEEETESVWGIILMALGFAFAILTMGSGTILLIGIVGGIAVGGAELTIAAIEYDLKSTHSATDFDRAKALSSDPSLFWLVVGAAFVAADIFGVTKILRAAKAATKVKSGVKASREEFEAALRRSPELNEKNLAEGVSPEDAIKRLGNDFEAAQDLSENIIKRVDLPGNHQLKHTKSGKVFLCSKHPCKDVTEFGKKYADDINEKPWVKERLEEIADLPTDKIDDALNDLKKDIYLDDLDEVMHSTKSRGVGRLKNRTDSITSRQELTKSRTATRRETTRLSNLDDTISIELELEKAIPRPISEFSDWFDSLTPNEFKTIWADKAAKKVISGRLRYPGGQHEWLKVSQTPKIKSWGISLQDIHTLRTRTVRTVGQSFKHGSKGSKIMHQKLDEMFRTSTTYKQFKRQLNDWADREMPGQGRAHLPKGLQMRLGE